MNAVQHDTTLLPNDDAPRDGDALAKNTRLQNDAFEIHAILGRGGQGITYRGMDVSLQRAVAIKEFFPLGSARQGAAVIAPSAMSAAEFATAREKFGQQARLLARFNHEGIARIFSVFEENDSAYMVMEFLQGQTLQQKLQARALPTDEAVSIATRIADALGALHETGLLHRAVSPGNIFLTQSGRAVLIDFVAARAISHSGQTVTVAAGLGYSPIEQYSDKIPLGPAADIYGLAASLYHALSGHAPPSAPDRLAGVDLPPLEKINPQIALALSQAVMHALEIQPQNRFQTAREFADALTEALKSAAAFSLAPQLLPAPRTPPAPQRGDSPAPRTPAAPPRGAATVALPDSATPSDAAPRTSATGSTPTAAPPMPQGAPPTVPQSTPAPPPGMQMCPHCQSPMPRVMTRCPNCRQLKTKSAIEETDGSFRQWHRNENTRIGLGWALAIGFVLVILFALAGGLSSLGLGPQRAPQTENMESLGMFLRKG